MTSHLPTPDRRKAEFA